MAVAAPIAPETIAAGHRLRETVFTTTGGPVNDARHFVPVAAGILCRTDCAGLWEVVLLPPTGHAVYLGHVEFTAGGWDAIDGNGKTVTEVRGQFADYLDAESALIANGSTEPAACQYEWPGWMLSELRGEPAPDPWSIY